MNKKFWKYCFLLLLSAIEAMPASTGIFKLSVKFVEGKYLTYIKDNGWGINDEHLTSIFDVGFTNKPRGLGFHLHITRAILQMNNIEIKQSRVEPVI